MKILGNFRKKKVFFGKKFLYKHYLYVIYEDLRHAISLMRPLLKLSMEESFLRKSGYWSPVFRRRID